MSDFRLIFPLVTTFAFATQVAFCDIPLIGENLSKKSFRDGDFEKVKSNKRTLLSSPFWQTTVQKGSRRVGIDSGRMSSGGNPLCSIQSTPLEPNPAFPKLTAGDKLAWRIAAKAEYPSDAKIIPSLIFGKQSHLLSAPLEVPAGNVEAQVFEGVYTVTQEDIELGMPSIRLELSTDYNINLFVEYVDLKVLTTANSAPVSLTTTSSPEGIKLEWAATKNGDSYNIYRSKKARGGFQKIATDVAETRFLDSKILGGLEYFYLVTLSGENESSASPIAAGK